MARVRDRETRKADTLKMLTRPAIDVWVATAASSSEPYLVPLSLAWVGERVLIALEASSPTARNLRPRDKRGSPSDNPRRGDDRRRPREHRRRCLREALGAPTRASRLVSRAA